jgi:predicted RNA methylase
MGTQNNRFGTVGNLTQIEVEREQMQDQVDSAKSIDERRRLGQFATPIDLAKEIVSYGLKIQNSNSISFLEPALGTGAFYSALLSELDKSDKVLDSAFGVEIDSDYYNAASSLWGKSIDILKGDFTTANCLCKTTFLISNPPYVRHHFMSQEQKIALNKAVSAETGIQLSGLSGLYCYFILLAHKWLALDAISGWLIPSEFMDVNYGTAIKKYLLNNVHLLRIHRYDPNDEKFDDALVSSCVVWFKNEIVDGDYEVEFSYGGTHENPQISKKVNRSVLEHAHKWTHYPAKDTLFVKEEFPTLGDFFNVKRGLATGDNDFFILTKEQIEQHNLDMAFFCPILPSPRHLKVNEVFQDENGYPALEPQRFLLNCTLSENEVKLNYPQLWNYLESGEKTTGSKYLCKNRKIWYLQEQRTPTPFLCSYMGRGGRSSSLPFRFILNHSGAVATNSYLMLYPKEPIAKAINANPQIVVKVWHALKEITAVDLVSEGRVYGGGLKKIEPKELSKVKCPHISELIGN